eukprot:6747564-Heterocapsa_arctica.AAC.1
MEKHWYTYWLCQAPPHWAVAFSHAALPGRQGGTGRWVGSGSQNVCKRAVKKPEVQGAEKGRNAVGSQTQ